MAQAFAIAGINPTIQYLSSKRFTTVVNNGVRCIGLPIHQTWLLQMPKLRMIALSIIQKDTLKRSGKNYSIIAPIGGPYLIKSERSKVNIVKQVGAKYLHPILEHPKVRINFSGEEAVAKYLKEVANLYDYLMPITVYLKKLFITNGRTKPTFLNPIIVNTQMISSSEITPSSENIHLLYSGNLRHIKEMKILFTAFSVVHSEIKKVRLEVLGGGSSRETTMALLGKYQRFCAELGIGDSVRFLGRISHNEVLQRYNNAHAFLLPRPFMEYSQAGFPIKLGEYLATGRPVITTGTGDIPLYLKDGVSAYVVMDDSPETFAKRVIGALKDPEANTVGQKGAIVAKEHFSIEATSNRIQQFFRSLNE